MSTALTHELASFVAKLRYDHLPRAVVPTIARGYTDCVGVMLAGANDPAPQHLRRVLAPGAGEASLLFTEARAPAPEAAWINGTAAHALDFDDVALKGHPSAVLVPAILAEAQSLEASGRQMVLAYAAGYEVWAELVRRDADKHQGKGWHPTGIFGSVAAAAACASLRGLDPARATVALAIGASQSAGLVSNFGTMTKPFHAGSAAHAGVIAARLADTGFSAASDALEHEPGFLHAVSPRGRIDVETPIRAGSEWALQTEGLDLKKYPVCFAVHGHVDGVLDLVAAHRFSAEEVERVETFVRRRHAIVLRYGSPQTALEAKFSMQFAIACALTERRVGLAEFNDAFVRRPDIQALIQRVTVTPDDREAMPPPAQPVSDRVRVALKNGRTLDSGPILRARGTHDLPLSSDELWEKFESCARAGGARVPARALFDTLMSLEHVLNPREIPGLA